MTFFDTNVVIDVLTRNPRWFDWSVGHVLDAAEDDGAIIDAVVVSELSPGYPSLSDLTAALDGASLRVMEIGEEAAFVAGHAFSRWRRSRADDAPRRVLPDFLIGAHAQTLGVPLATRDQRLYRSYFPDLTLITPETDHG